MSYNLTAVQLTVIIMLAVWELIWKGLALWRAGRNKQKAWFIAVLVINTAGLLPIIYLLTNKDNAAGKPAGDTSS